MSRELEEISAIVDMAIEREKRLSAENAELRRMYALVDGRQEKVRAILLEELERHSPDVPDWLARLSDATLQTFAEETQTREARRKFVPSVEWPDKSEASPLRSALEANDWGEDLPV